jgi:putative membrane-bound dehydrogenase-like protein
MSFTLHPVFPLTLGFVSDQTVVPRALRLLMKTSSFLSSSLILLASPLSSLLGAPPVPPTLNDPELKLELFASYPEVETPTTVAASPDGAVFVGNDPRDSRLNTKNPECTVVRYSGVGSDRKKTVFAEKLYSPAGMLWHDGWLYVAHNPLLTRFKDTTGNGVANIREDIVADLGQNPSEGLNDHVVSGFTLGMDGFFYISVGDKGVYHAKGKDGSEVTLLGGGIVRCRPDGTGLEIYSGGTRNHLEVNLDALDRPFTLDNTDDGNGWWTRLEYHVESGYYGYPYFYKHDQTNGLLAAGPQKAQPFPGAPAVNERILPSLTDFGGGSPTGGLCYMSDGLPEKYRGRQMFSEWGQRKLSVIEVAREGAAFKHVKNEALLEDKTGAFRPMELYVAHDGSLLVSDWGFSGWKTPRQVGSVWRISWPNAKPAPRLPDAEKASVADLLTALNHPDRDQRLRAQWALVHHGAPVVEAVVALAKTASAPVIQRAHALWTLDLLGNSSSTLRTQSTGVLLGLLKDPQPEIRAQAVRALSTHWVKESAPQIASLIKDSDAEVRMLAAIALGRIGVSEQAGALLSTLSDEDRWVRFVGRASLVKLGGWDLVAPLLKSADARIQEQAWLLFTDVADPRAVAILAKMSADPDVAIRTKATDALGRAAYLPAEWDGHWWSTQPVKNPPPLNDVVWEGTPAAIAALSTALADSATAVRLAAAKGLAYGIGVEALPALRLRLTSEGDPVVRRQLVETLGVQKDRGALPVFTKIALDTTMDAEFRDTAIMAAANIGGEDAKQMIATLSEASLSPAATLKVVQSAGELKVLEAVPALKRHVQSPDKLLRLAAIKSLVAFGTQADALDAFTGALANKDGETLTATLEALAKLHDKRALPALLELTTKKGVPIRSLVQAIAGIQEPETIPFLVSALKENNTGARSAAIGALKKMRAQSWPLIEQNITSGTIPPEFVAEIRYAFDSGIIAKWKIIGPFENVWGAVHPPEEEALKSDGKPDLSSSHLNAEGKNVAWHEQTSSPQDGLVDLGQLFKNEGMVCAYAYTEIEAKEEVDTKLFCGSRGQIALWLNGKKVHDVPTPSRPLNSDQDEVWLHLKAGVNRILVKIGNQSGPWQFAARIPGLEGNRFAFSREAAPDAKQRAFALLTKPDGSFTNPGNIARGEKVFWDPAGPLGAICANCHAVGGKGGQIGPDLSAIAVNYKRADLITSIHEPSKTIALGFEQFLITTTGGDLFAGAIRQETNDTLTVLGIDAQPHVVKKADIKSRTAVETSLMPAGLTLGLKPGDFTDLLAYLESLKGK